MFLELFLQRTWWRWAANEERGTPGTGPRGRLSRELAQADAFEEGIDIFFMTAEFLARHIDFFGFLVR